MKLSHSIFEYSAKKNNANVIEEYSTLYPATISASASGRSKGARFVSAKIEIKNTTAAGRSGAANQAVFICLLTISTILNEPAHSATGKIISPIETSYDISCAADLRAPKKAYLELLDQPDKIIP